MIDLEDVQRSITAETRILVASYVQFATGFRQDLVSMGRLCRERKLIFVVDATQGMASFPSTWLPAVSISWFSVIQVGPGWLWRGRLYSAPRFLNTSSFPVAGWWSVRDPAPLGGQLGASTPNCLANEAGAEALPLWEEIWPGPAMKLVGPLAARSPGLRLALALEIERHGSADEILQGRLIDLVAFVDVDGAPGIPLEAGVE